MTRPAAKRQKTEQVGTLDVKPQTKYEYLAGFGGEKSSEAIKGALPEMYNTPQRCPFGLYAEQLNGTAFTKPRAVNQRTWMYRIRPSAVHEEMVEEPGYALAAKCTKATPKQLRWAPTPIKAESHTFIQGLVPHAGAGDPSLKSGVCVYLYTCNTSMKDTAFYNSDGDLLIVPQEGELDVVTEMGRMQVRPGEICVVQRGIKFKVDPVGDARGYACELYDGHFTIPDLGPIGANGMANPRDFLTPVAWYEDVAKPFKVYNKFCSEMFSYQVDRSPFDVVAWHGSYAPYKYDLARFCVVNSVSYDHLDPSIFTVLTCQTADPGTAAMDFVIFPPRYMVQMNTFRPPYYHKNTMSELMGNIAGRYEAKETGFLPGGVTLHSCMAGHGPDKTAFDTATALDTTTPQKPSTTDLAFMFESAYLLKLNPAAAASPQLDKDYQKVWHGLTSNFTPPCDGN